VQTSGNDAFFRNPYNVEECLFVNITSPSSSKFDSVQSLGTPQQAAERLRQQYLSEFMSTRLGSQKKVDILSASSREADGRLYYDIEVRRAPSAQCMHCNSDNCGRGVWL
jgi:PsbP